MYILGFIALFLIVGFLIGLFAKDEIAYGLILIITIAWVFAFGPWAIATFIELVIGYSLGSKIRPVAGDILEEKLQELEEEQEESSKLWLWLLYGSAGGIFLLTQILPSSDSEQHKPTPESLEPQNQAYLTSAKNESIKEKVGAQPFTIKVTPSNARVRIMNINPKYQDGIILDDGLYDILVDALGYISWRQNIQHSGRPTYRHIKLNEKITSNSKVNKRANVTSIIDDRYRNNSDGTIIDTTTKLQWMRCSIGQSWNGRNCSGSAYRLKWEDIIKQSPDFAGHNDWRIPEIDELRSLIYCSNGKSSLYPAAINEGRICKGVPKRDYQKPTINIKAFPNTPAVPYWSITTTDSSKLSTWFVNFYYGSLYSGYTFDDYKGKNQHRIRLVRNL